MKSFKFRLENLLKARELKVQETLQALEEAQQELLKAQKELQRLTFEIQTLKDDIHRIQSSPKGLHELEDCQNYYSSLQDRKVYQQDEIMRLENIYTQKKRATEEALKEKKIIEKLKEKQYKEWNERAKKLEAKIIDEAAVAQFLRNAEAKNHE